jgi:hypothetical protein
MRQFNRSKLCENHLKHFVVGGRIIEQRGRTPRRLLLVAQGSTSSMEEIFVVIFVKIDGMGRGNAVLIR